MISAPCYCTREMVARALDQHATTRTAAQIDRGIEAAVERIDGDLHRTFIPWVGTRTFDWPPPQAGDPWTLYLDGQDLVSLTSATSGGQTIPTSALLLRPDKGPPFTKIELNRAAGYSFGGGSTPQRDVALTGTWGYRSRWATVGATAEALDATETSVDVDGPTAAAAGIGDLAAVESEWMTVTGRALLDTGQDLTGALAAQASAVAAAVPDGTTIAQGEVLTVDAERLLVEDIAGNTLIVKRAWDGSTLAAHSIGASVYASRTLRVLRGVQGTTAAAHSTSAAIALHVVASLVRQLAVAEAESGLLQELSGYARTVGSGENVRTASLLALKQLREDAYTAHGRKARHRAV